MSTPLSVSLQLINNLLLYYSSSRILYVGPQRIGDVSYRINKSGINSHTNENLILLN